MNKTKKVCQFCGSKCVDISNLDVSMLNSNVCCEKCKEIESLQILIKDYIKDYRMLEINNTIYDKNMVEDPYQQIEGITSYSSRFHRTNYRIVKRTKFVKNIIDTIDFVRKFLSIDIAAQFEILDSIYNKDVFWKESGNLILYVHNASIEYIVIKLKELLTGSGSKYSIEKLKNVFIKEKKRIFNNSKIVKVFKYENGESFEIEYKPFHVIEYLNKIEVLLNEYSGLINDISDFRDNKCAHIGKLKNQSHDNLTYINIKRIYNMIKIIYDGFMIAIAPDKFATLVVDHNIWFSNLNRIVKEYRENRQKK